MERNINFKVEIDGISKLKSLIAENERLIGELRYNVMEIEHTYLGINAKFNQLPADTDN